jgi:hypothetical protein
VSDTSGGTDAFDVSDVPVQMHSSNFVITAKLKQNASGASDVSDVSGVPGMSDVSDAPESC